ncbi:hypothetical protein PRIPAC_78086 [Pristionchus pacificus]|uniref:Dehydrogenase n=1 Tax=Pristionchus pacificus TaxID=54126 RepID=A0A454Y6J8_PRIPA|nr:hypothetical protein PRIPAC_78086 [Pristionchus pacificus]|eukprot:PDM79286.1 dehydrogenase [Pristionchus pacificus]
MRSVLVTGGNRGVGLGLVRELLKDPSVSIVIATARSVDTANDLKVIDNPKLRIVACDVTDENSIAAAVEKVSEIVKDQGLDLLINNAGIYPPLDADVSKAIAMRQFEVNAVGPLLVAQAFHNFLKRAAEQNGSAQVANITTVGGSLALARDQYYSPPTTYAMSKAALNMLTRKLSLEWKGDNIRVTAFTPGWVRTDMGGPDAMQSVEEATVPLVKLILSLSEEHNDQFYKITGEKIPW